MTKTKLHEAYQAITKGDPLTSKHTEALNYMYQQGLIAAEVDEEYEKHHNVEQYNDYDVNDGC